ncbi:hypothetical protein CR513_33506, partial [Mucuna pruriens]
MEKELLAIVFALNKFRAYLLGSKVIVFSDHAALKCIPNAEFLSMLHFYHSAPRGDHYGSTQTAHKVLDCGFYWPTIY